MEIQLSHLILTSVGWIIALVAIFIGAIFTFNRKFDAIGDKFDIKIDALETKFNTRFDTIDRRFESIDRRFESIDRKFEAIDRRFESMDRKFEAIDLKIDGLQNLILQHLAQPPIPQGVGVVAQDPEGRVMIWPSPGTIPGFEKPADE